MSGGKSRRPAEIWHVSREFGGLAEAGGVKDAVRGLAAALARRGMRVSVVLPRYGFLAEEPAPEEPLAAFSLPMPDQDRGNEIRQEPVRILQQEKEGVRILLVDSPCFAEKRDVYTFTEEDERTNPHKRKGTGHWDFHRMNLVLQRSALRAAASLGAPDIFHCHDGHAAFLPAIAREDPLLRDALGRSASVVTIHNAGTGYHQEIWDRGFARLVTGLPDGVLDRGLLRNTVDPLLLAASYAPLGTVSEQYARELLQEEEENGLSGGLGPALRSGGVPLTGITNGVDPHPFDPRPTGGAGIPYPFDPSQKDWRGKRLCRNDLGARLGLADTAEEQLFGFIGRLTPQKGIDVLAGALSALLTTGQCPLTVILGQGSAQDEEKIARLVREGRGRIRFESRFDSSLAKLIYASCDFLLIPSAYEPCGLTDFYAQLMGTLPLVHRVGGLVKVRDGETGFSYDEQSPTALADAIRRAARFAREEPARLESMRSLAFTEIFERHTWDRVARDGYIPFYEAALAGGRWTRR